MLVSVKNETFNLKDKCSRDENVRDGCVDWTRRDMIKNEVIHDKVKVVSTLDKIREARLRWYGHAK